MAWLKPLLRIEGVEVHTMQCEKYGPYFVNEHQVSHDTWWFVRMMQYDFERNLPTRLGPYPPIQPYTPEDSL